MQPPTLHKVADRAYRLDAGDVGNLRQYLENLGWTHRTPKAADLYRHLWRSPDGRTVATLFTDGRLVVLGPSSDTLDALEVTA